MLRKLFSKLGRDEELMDEYVELRREDISESIASVDKDLTTVDVMHTIREIEDHAVNHLEDEVDEHGEQYVRVMTQNGFIDKILEEVEHDREEDN